MRRSVGCAALSGGWPHAISGARRALPRCAPHGIGGARRALPRCAPHGIGGLGARYRAILFPDFGVIPGWDSTSEKLIARSREVGVLLDALDPAPTQARAVVLEGEPGVGKTALWRYAVEAAGERGFTVVASAPTASEAPLAFAALGDLLDVGLDDALCALPPPQR